jgi:hypothetical protein
MSDRRRRSPCESVRGLGTNLSRDKGDNRSGDGGSESETHTGICISGLRVKEGGIQHRELQK